jgi:hypothetical protein
VRRLGFLTTLLTVLGTARAGVAQDAAPCNVPAADSVNLAEAATRVTDGRTSLGDMWLSCSRPSLVIASGWIPAWDDSVDYGPRLLVFRQLEPHRYNLAFVSAGLLESALPYLYLFEAGSRVLILADVGDEGSWGLDSYELVADSLAGLGILDVGIPAAYEDEPDESAIEHVSVLLRQGRWRAYFDTTVVLRPNHAQDRDVLADARLPIAFEQALPFWHRLGRSVRAN